MRKHEVLTSSDPPQDAFGISAKLKHRDGFHGMNFKLKLNFCKSHFFFPSAQRKKVDEKSGKGIALLKP